MKTINKFLTLGVVALSAASCSLDLGPIDYYGSQNYWQSEANVIGYVDGLQKSMRDFTFDHTILLGEIRSGIYVDGVAYDGMTTSYGVHRGQNMTFDSPGFSNFDNIFGRITNCNLLIARAPDVDMNADKKNYCLAVAHAMRAFYYFDLYRVWGGVPMRLDVEVIDGELDPVKLTKPRSTPKEIMAQIKDDLNKSLEYFGNQTGWDVLGRGSKCYWNKAATLCLAAEVYMWNAKVAVGDQPAVPGDMATAIKYLEDVKNGYGLDLEPKFGDIFDATKKCGKEVIFAVRYKEGEATNSNFSWTYNTGTGSATTNGFREDGTPWNDPLQIVGLSGTNMSMAYCLDMWNQYDYCDGKKLDFDGIDTRKRATFIAQMRYTDDDEFYLYGIHTKKNIGYINGQGVRIACGDYILYRLAWVYLSLAEAYNFEGRTGECETMINKVRARAYGANWDEAKHGFKAGSFTDNEYAILAEKDKEFIQEGQRWWDLRRMTEVKGGSYMEHFVFKDRAAHPSNSGLIAPVLTEDIKHKVLYPLDNSMLSKDTSLDQNKGYETIKGGKTVDWDPNGN